MKKLKKILCGIYAIENTINGKRYYGSSKNIKQRLKQHIYSLQNNNHHSQKLQNAWNKYGAENFRYFVIESFNIAKNEYIDPVLLNNTLVTREQHYINEHNTCGERGYNIATANRNASAYPHTSQDLRNVQRLMEALRSIVKEKTGESSDEATAKWLNQHLNDNFFHSETIRRWFTGIQLIKRVSTKERFATALKCDPVDLTDFLNGDLSEEIFFSKIFLRQGLDINTIKNDKNDYQLAKDVCNILEMLPMSMLLELNVKLACLLEEKYKHHQN